MKKTYQIKAGKNTVTLTDKDYIAAGGQGVVFVQKGLAYKIYHDPKQTIPVAKINELAALTRPDILGPKEPIYDLSNTPIGFTMDYVDGVEFLCKIFTQEFRNDQNLSPQDVSDLVVSMQKALEYVHSKSVLVVDYNEMNFLLGKKIVYHIDVDSWQTKHFKAPAIMESIRDRSTPKGVFTEFTDWFSFAVVTFQMYAGIHPYKGMHPDFKPSEWAKRMEQGVSVFDKKTKIPASCQNFNVIPKRHLEWYKDIFSKGQRSIPPYPDDVTVPAQIKTVIVSKGDFIIKLLESYDENIRSVYHYNNRRYVITDKALYHADKKVCDLYPKIRTELYSTPGNDPILVCKKNSSVDFLDLKKNLITSVPAENMMMSNGLIYIINNGFLIENTFENMGKLFLKSHVVCDISRSYKVYRGIITQDDFMSCHLAIPYASGKCVNIHAEELDGSHIIDAHYHNRIAVVISEKTGAYFQTIFHFYDNWHNNYTVRDEQINEVNPANFIVLPNKLCVHVEQNKISLFKDNTKRKELADPPIEPSMRLYNEDMTVLFADGKKLYSMGVNYHGHKARGFKPETLNR